MHHAAGVALSYRYGYFPAVTACVSVFFSPALGGSVPFLPIPSMLDCPIMTNTFTGLAHGGGGGVGLGDGTGGAGGKGPGGGDRR